MWDVEMHDLALMVMNAALLMKKATRSKGHPRRQAKLDRPERDTTGMKLISADAGPVSEEDLMRENAWLKQLLAEMIVDNEILRERIEKEQAGR